jgi:hypothetical protein
MDVQVGDIIVINKTDDVFGSMPLKVERVSPGVIVGTFIGTHGAEYPYRADPRQVEKIYREVPLYAS